MLRTWIGGDATVRERQGSGGWWLRSPRWESLRRKGVEKTGTAPSSGAGLMPAPPPPLAPGAVRPAQSRLIPPLRPKTLQRRCAVASIPAPLPLTHDCVWMCDIFFFNKLYLEILFCIAWGARGCAAWLWPDGWTEVKYILSTTAGGSTDSSARGDAAKLL